jgi:hypothetical protein
LAQCRDLERLYPGQWDNTEKVWAVHEVALKKPDTHLLISRAHSYAYAKVLAAAPSLGEMVRVIKGSSRFYEAFNLLRVIHAEHPEEYLADVMIHGTRFREKKAALIAAGGG